MFWAHNDPVEFVEWVRGTRGEAILFELQKTSRDIGLCKSVDFETVKESLGVAVNHVG